LPNRVCELLGIDLPLLAFSHCRDVVVEVSKAGGFGVLGASAHSPEGLEQELAWIDRNIGGRPYGVDILIPGKLAWGFVVAMVLSLSFIAYYRFSRAGISMRATSSDLVTAAGLGINVHQSFALTWAISGVLASMCGLILASINGLTPQLGFVVLDIIAVVFLGGISSVGGTVIAGLFIGWLATIIGAYLGANWQSVLPFVVVLLVMMFRPRGLLGEKRIERI